MSARDRNLLGFDPFAGDKDSDGWKDMPSKIVTTKKAAPCLFDAEEHEIPVGSLAVRFTAVKPGKGWRSFLICADCIEGWNKKWGVGA